MNGNSRNNNYRNNNGNYQGKNKKTKEDGIPFDFLNPYTFVPFQEERAEQVSWERTYNSDNELLTGWLDIKMELKTPMIIPDTSRCTKEIVEKGKEHYHYPFFRLPDENKTLAVPGSSLRGMIRNVYETLTDSCVSNLMDEKPISQRNPLYAGLKKRGLLHYDPEKKIWELYEAEVYRKKCGKQAVIEGTYKGFKTGDKVLFAHDSYGELEISREKKTPSYDTGWIQFNIPIQKEYSIAVLQPKYKKALHSWKAGDYTPEKKLLSALSRDGVVGNVPRAPRPMNDLKNKLLMAQKGEGNYVPVYYLKFETEEGPEIYLSGSSIGRVGRNKKWKDIMGDYVPCTKIDSLCPACLLFGTAADGGTKGRLRFTDALPVDGQQLTTEKHTLQILSTPRPSAFEFYLNKPEENASYWNFDYYTISKKNPKTQKMEAEFHRVDQMMPRGRKYYWNHETILEDAKSKTNMNATMECVSQGDFGFRIYFDEINPQQLNDIIWSVTLGENTDKSKIYHKIGHGKPLGYGSVKLTVKDAVIRKAVCREDKIDIKLIPVKVDEKTEAGTKCRLGKTGNGYVLTTEKNAHRGDVAKNILAVCNSERSKKLTISYPIDVNKKNEESIFEWFSKNRIVNTARRSPTILPCVTAYNLTMKGHKKDPSVKPQEYNKFNSSQGQKKSYGYGNKGRK